MKTKFIITCLILAFISCKDVKKEEEKAKEVKKPITFDVITDVVVKKDDDLIVYYKDGTNEWFDEQHAIWVNVKGSDALQTITFSLPEGVLPNNLRFDFSKNPLQEPVKISKIRISYLKNSFDVNENDITRFFEINECVKYDKSTKLYTPIKDSKGIYDPFLSITMDFYNQMDRVIKT